ncbi:ParB/RepB/Spo0J family partition protein [Fimbriiglobus ruber]|uniref:Chromosome (Plasmid) partitioning protein ParB / Stage 0 sporulation protein J n=1 Tax=Fimbriiglobus ruber TaxID=1908690 RepID=A0A225E179_9BACT|nr:ParB/RepB/Spo0J family partition protein [Fimbriiglobus ruber]OWK47321.1 Chromosome (plasmid) partitioning protein ParB / Stage 0 sporulation protein J [Fimbriiglobus ruber]
MQQIVKYPVIDIKPDPNNPRKAFEQADLQYLGASLKWRQIEPIHLRRDGTLIDGERRWRAAQLVGLETLNGIVWDDIPSPQELAAIRLTTFFQRVDLTPFEKFQACEELLRLNNWNGKQLAGYLKIDPASVTKILAAGKVCEHVRDAFAAGTISQSDVYAISKAEGETEQKELLAAKLSGLSRDQLERKRTRAARGSDTESRLTTVKVSLHGGTLVTLRGHGLTLAGVIDHLSETLKSARRAHDSGHPVTTWIRMMNDRSHQEIPHA